MTFEEILDQAVAMLQRRGRVTYRVLKRQFDLDDDALEDLKEDILYSQPQVIDDEGKGLIWTGESGTKPEPEAAPTPPVQPEVTEQDRLIQPEPSPEPPAPDAERRQLTVMFCDLADSTRLSGQLDPEDLREVVRAYQATAAEIVQQYEGHMAQYLGDGLLIYFGWPVAHEDDAQRSLHAGLGIVQAITTMLNPRLEAEKGVQLTVRLGIHTGPVVVGEMGGGGRHENLATGETVNIAARLEGLAAPNTVLISNVTARLTQDAFDLERLGAQVLKGVAEPIDVFRVARPLDIDHDDEESLPDGGMFLVGRDKEIGLLLRRWEQAKEGLGQVVLISGEAGIGKSSLVATLRHYVVRAGYTRIAFRCSPYHTNSALYPVIEHVQRVLQFKPGDTPATRLDKLERVLKTYSRPLEEVVPLYAALLSVLVPEERYTALNLSPQQQRQQTQDALVGWLLEEAERQPTLTIWEDLHWADPSTLELLAMVLEQTPIVPMLHVLTYRPAFELPWPTRSHMTPITLNRMERPQVEALIMHLAGGGKALPDDVMQHIVAKTDGVPLYVEELTKMLLASDLVREEPGQYILTGPLASVAIPDTLQDSLMARLDQMHTAKEVAQLGAVLGREFTYALIRGISSQDETALQTALTRLVEAELLYQRGRPPRSRYMFKHALIQDAANASLLRSTRQQMHQQVAQQLEAHFPEVVETQPELVAHHYTEAGLNEQAIDYWHRSGQRAIERSANVEAVSHLTKGLELLKTLADTGERTRYELTLLMVLGPALSVTKGWAAPDVEHAYARARELCQQVGDTPQLFVVLRALFYLYYVRAELQTAHEFAEHLLQLADQQQDTVWRLFGHHSLGVDLLMLGEIPPARMHLDRGIALYNPQGHSTLAFRYGHDPGTLCLAYAGLALWLLGYAEQALQRGHEAVSLAQSLSHPYSLSVALYIVAVVHQWRREGQLTREHADAIVALATEQEFPLVLAFGTILRGWALTDQGRGAEGIVHIHQGLTANQDIGVGLFRPYFLVLLAQVYGQVSQPGEGLTALGKALAIIDKTGERWCEAEL